ncbi:MAG: LptF/LptG family permease, partial [Candidatus Marinimicrobia bacterium]|nr:LptF/LptG family permease [Candidatus Neomarinimicrobiota bacterium]
MKKLSIYIIGELFPPFLLGLVVIVFIFLMNFMIKAVDKILGKGIEAMVILEYVGLNIAWIIALAIPMSVLIASLMAYGRLSDDNEITALKAAGVSFTRIILPGLIFAVAMAGFMVYFNNNVLPDFNHRARMLGSDIYRTRPDLTIEEGYFTNDIPGYSLLVRKKNGEILEDVTIYNDENSQTQTTITAQRGRITIKGNRVVLDLENGEIHELNVTNPEEYRRIEFEYHRFTIPIENMTLERSTTRRRGDREMSAEMMRGRVIEINAKIAKAYEKLQGHSNNNLKKVFRSESDLDDEFDLESSVWPLTSNELGLSISRSLRG